MRYVYDLHSEEIPRKLHLTGVKIWNRDWRVMAFIAFPFRNAGHHHVYVLQRYLLRIDALRQSDKNGNLLLSQSEIGLLPKTRLRT